MLPNIALRGGPVLLAEFGKEHRSKNYSFRANFRIEVGKKPKVEISENISTAGLFGIFYALILFIRQTNYNILAS